MLLCQLAAALMHAGRFADAEQEVEYATRLCQEKLPATSPVAAACLHLKALAALNHARRFAKAEEIARQSRELWKKADGDNAARRAATANNLGVLCLLRGDYAGAEELLNGVRNTWSDSLGEADARRRRLEQPGDAPRRARTRGPGPAGGRDGHQDFPGGAAERSTAAGLAPGIELGGGRRGRAGAGSKCRCPRRCGEGTAVRRKSAGRRASLRGRDPGQPHGRQHRPGPLRRGLRPRLPRHPFHRETLGTGPLGIGAAGSGAAGTGTPLLGDEPKRAGQAGHGPRRLPRGRKTLPERDGNPPSDRRSEERLVGRSAVHAGTPGNRPRHPLQRPAPFRGGAKRFGKPRAATIPRRSASWATWPRWTTPRR